MAGDIDPSAMGRLVGEYFGGWPQVGQRPAAANPRIAEYRESRFAVVSDPQVTQAEARVVCVRSGGRPSTVGGFRRRLAAGLACRVLNRRLLILSQEESAPIEQVSASLSQFLGTWTFARASLAGSSGQAMSLLRLLLLELARIERYGFLVEELEQAKSSTLQIARRALERADGRSSSYLLREMNEAVADGRPPMSAAQRLELSRSLVADLEPLEVAAAFRESFCARSRLVLALVPEGEGAETLREQDLDRVAREVERSQIRPPTPRAFLPRLLDDSPSPGTVVAGSDSATLGVFSTTLSSGIRVHLREMDARKDRVYVQLTVAGGRIREREETYGLTSVAATALQEGTTERLDAVAVRDVLGPTSVSLSSLVEEDCVRLGLAAEARDLESGMQLLHLLLSQAKIDPAALRRWRSRIERWRPDLESRLAERVLQHLSGGDPRFRLLDVDRSRAIGLAEAQSWLEDLIRNGPVEVAIVGDMERQRALDLTLRYLGSLEERPLVDAGLDSLRRLHSEPGPCESSVEAPDDNSRAAVLIAWRAAPWPQPTDRRAMLMSEWILKRRLIREVREKRGLTYSVNCSYRPSKAYPEGSLFTVAFFASPRRVEEALDAARQVVESLTSRGPSEVEMARGRKRFRHLVDSVLRKPQFWARTLSDLEYHGSRLEDLGSLQEDYSSLTTGRVKRTLRRYIEEPRRIQVISLPSRAEIGPPLPTSGS